MGKKASVLITLALLIMQVLSGCRQQIQSPGVTPTVTPVQEEDITINNDTEDIFSIMEGRTQIRMIDYLEKQNETDALLQAEMGQGYTFGSPLTITDPYGMSPLTAVIIFTTENVTGVKAVINGKSAENDIEVTFPRSRDHCLTIYGLYPGTRNKVVLTLDDGRKSNVYIETDDIDTIARHIDILSIDEESVDRNLWTFICLSDVDNGSFSYAGYDNAGDLRWILDGRENVCTMRRAENGNILIMSSRFVQEPYYVTGILEMDMCGKVYKDYLIPGGVHHDFCELPDGNLLVCVNRENRETFEDYIVEVDRLTGEIVYRLDIMTLLDYRDGASPRRTDTDWFHTNSIDYNQETDTILLSGENADVIIGVGKTLRQIKWIIGDNTGWQYTDNKLFLSNKDTEAEGVIGESADTDKLKQEENVTTTDPVRMEKKEWPYRPSSAGFIDKERILLFDNRFGEYSRAVMYKIDTRKMQVEPYWEYGKERGEDWHAYGLASAQYLHEDSVFLTSGSTVTGISSIIEIKGTDIVFEAAFSGNTFKATRMRLYPERISFSLDRRGEYLGSIGSGNTLLVNQIQIKDAKSVNFEFRIEQRKEGVYASGKAKRLSEDARIVLITEEGTAVAYALEGMASSQMLYSVFIPGASHRRNSYAVFIINNGVTYDTGYRVDFN